VASLRIFNCGWRQAWNALSDIPRWPRAQFVEAAGANPHRSSKILPEKFPREFPGGGVEARLNGDMSLSDAKFLQERGFSYSPSFPNEPSIPSYCDCRRRPRLSHVFVALNGKPVWHLVFTDLFTETTPEAIKALRARDCGW